jgi:hypothetical protein
MEECRLGFAMNPLPSRRNGSLLRWAQAFVFAVCLLALTRLVPGWGRWHTIRAYYRDQTEALLHGNLALSDSPWRLTHDLAWSGGGVQQVWGLGVPAWRLPFELAARACGQEGFPDRLELGAAIMLAVWVFLKIWLGIQAVAAPGEGSNAKTQRRKGGQTARSRVYGRRCAVLFSAFHHPPEVEDAGL